METTVPIVPMERRMTSRQCMLIAANLVHKVATIQVKEETVLPAVSQTMGITCLAVTLAATSSYQSDNKTFRSCFNSIISNTENGEAEPHSIPWKDLPISKQMVYVSVYNGLRNSKGSNNK
jgi:hypothetical protein